MRSQGLKAIVRDDGAGQAQACLGVVGENDEQADCRIVRAGGPEEGRDPLSGGDGVHDRAAELSLRQFGDGVAVDGPAVADRGQVVGGVAGRGHGRTSRNCTAS